MEEETETVGKPADKRILLIGAGVILVIIVIVAFIFLSSISQRNASRQNLGSTNPTPTGSAILSPKVAAEFPTVVAKNFYDWYVNHPSPIKSGAYKTREDVTADFKEVMGSFASRGIDPGYDHVFCEISSLPKNVALGELKYDENSTLALVMFKDSGGQDLFQMKLANLQGKWLVADVWCP